jgi:hypothetical protein
MTLAVFGSPRPVLSVDSWIIIQNKVPQGTGSVSFDQNWLAYRNGFGDLTMTSNYWIGNEVIYGLVSTGNYKLRVEVMANYSQVLVFDFYRDAEIREDSNC